MMQRLLFILFLAVSFSGTAQIRNLGNTGSEFGLTLGACNFLGDLGGANRIGRPLFWDLELGATRPVLGAMYRLNFNHYFATRFNFFWGNVAGDDKLVKPRDQFTDEWYRWYRNLHFKSYILEFSFQVEINFSKFEIGRRRYRFAPYGFVGAGLTMFNPKARDTGGSWVKLRNLGTEGQGLPEYPDRKPYSLMTMCVPVGIGGKYNVNRQWTIGFEYGHRFTFSDYIDDVSKTYPDPAFIDAYYPATTAGLVKQMSRRSIEVDPLDLYKWTTAPDQQRGDPTDNDAYIFTGMITITYTVGKGKIYCPKFH